MSLSRYSLVNYLALAGIGAALFVLGMSVARIISDAPTATFASEPQFIARVPTLTGFKPTWTGNGTLTVPAQVAPGLYLVAPDDNSLGCVWQRLKATDGEIKSIIKNGQMARGATPQLVTIEKTDKYLQFLGGCAFRKVA